MRVRGRGKGEIWPIVSVALFFKVHTRETRNQKKLDLFQLMYVMDGTLAKNKMTNIFSVG